MIRLLFLLFPLAEIAGFIVVGRAIGIVSTLGLVLGAAVIGMLLIRRAGLNVFREARIAVNEGRSPGPHVVGGFLSALAGILLIAPGFLSDLLALVLLLPPVRDRAWNALKGRMRFAGAPRPQPQARVIDLERTDYSSPSSPSSPWKARPGGSA